MKEIYYVYNNEAISSCIFLSILNHIGRLNIARSCLILPFLLDDRTINYLTNNESINLEEFVREQPRLFVSFNKRYLSLLPVAINSLMLLSKSNKIRIENDIVSNKFIQFSEQDFGDRFSKINNVVPNFLEMINSYSTTQLYKILNVQL